MKQRVQEREREREKQERDKKINSSGAEKNDATSRSQASDDFVAL